METTKRKYQKHKMDYTISTNYFLRKEKNASVSRVTGEELFPVYIRVIVKRQSTKIRSRLNLSIPESFFQEYISIPEVAKYIENETKIIQDTIKLFRPDQVQNFELKEWLQYYELGSKPIKDCALVVLMNRLVEGLEKDYNMNKEDLAPLKPLSFKSLKFLVKLNVPLAMELDRQWGLLSSLDLLETKATLHNRLRPKLCFWDWKSGYYREVMTKVHGDSATSFLESIDSLMPDFEKLINSTS